MSEKILAVAAGHEITEKELNNLIANYPPEQQVYLSNPQAKDELLEQLIGFHLFAKMADEEKIKESQEYKETLEKMKNELASHMAATGVISKVTVEDSEVKAYFDANPTQFAGQEQVKAKHILTETEEQAAKILEELKNGKEFEAMCRAGMTPMEAIKAGMDANEAVKKFTGSYGRTTAEQGIVKTIDPRKE